MHWARLAAGDRRLLRPAAALRRQRGQPRRDGCLLTAPEGAPDGPKSIVQLLRRTRYGRYFLASLLGNMGVWLQDIATAIFIYELTGSALWVATVAVVGFGTSIVLAPVGGVMADRFNRRAVLGVSYAALAIASAAIAIGIASGIREVAFVLVVSTVAGIARAVNSPSAHALVPALVSPADLPTAATLLAVCFNLARALGPAGGALLVATVGTPGALGAAAVCCAALVLLLPGLGRVGDPPRRHSGAARMRLWPYLRDQPVLLALLVSAGLIGMMTDPGVTLGPALADTWGLDAAYAGLLVSAFGVGAVASAPVAPALRRRVGPLGPAMVGFAAVAVSFAVAALAGGPVVGAICFALAGFAFLVTNADVTTAIQERIPDAVRGRIMALWTIAFLGSRPVAAVIDGALGDELGPEVALVVMAGVAGGGALLAGVTRVRSR